MMNPNRPKYYIYELAIGMMAHFCTGYDPVRALISGLRAAPLARLASETPRCGSVCEANARIVIGPGVLRRFTPSKGCSPCAC